MDNLKPIDIAARLYNEYCEINHIIPTINSGGCGVFAEHLYRVLRDMDLNPLFVIFTNDKVSMEKRVANSDEYWGYASVAHIMIELDGNLIDCEGIYDSVKDTRYNHYQECKTLDLFTLTKWNLNPNQWNSTFDRRHITTIENKLNECYQKVYLSLRESDKEKNLGLNLEESI